MSKYDIAIIGMGCIFPKANSVDQYWENILTGDSYIKEMPEDLWHLRNFYSSEPNVAEKSYTVLGSFIEEFEFPFLDYRLPPKAMKGVDPAQLVTLEATKEALKDANIEDHSDQLADAVTVIGVSGVDGFAHTTAFLRRHRYFNKLRPLLESQGVPAAQIEELDELFARQLENRGHQWNPAIASVGAIPSSISNRVAQVFGVKGYNMTVDAACGSSFVALDVASQALMAGDARIAITGGTDLGTNPSIYVGFSRVDGLSKSGHSNPFDHTADGLIIGEGVGMIVLKRMEDAIADGDHIKAVIRGIGSSSDGAGQAIYAPSVQGRSLAFERGLKKADTSPHDVQFLEAHATSTVVGDANEYDSIATIYAPGRDSAQPLKLGSVKGQIGHLKAAAGVAGLIKTVLAMENGVYPHMPRYTQLTPHAKLSSPALEIPTETSPWQPHSDGKRVAAVTTSGFGGVNYHMILEQAETYQPPAQRPHVSREMAVVGVSLRVAGADTVEKFWDNVTHGKNVMVDADPVALDWADHLDAGPENERITTRVVSKLEDYDPQLLKHKIFPKAVSQIAPTQLLALDLADRLLEGAGLKQGDQKDIAVSVGSMHDDYFPTIFSPMVADEYSATIAECAADSTIDKNLLVDSAKKAAQELKEDGPPVTEHTLPGWMTNVTAGRMANKLNLVGPNFTVDSACSSGLAALIPAQYQLMFGDVDMVISGGLNRQLSAEFTCGVCALGAVAEKVAKPFDADGAGFLIGEGGVFYLLKRLEDAKRNGDDIFAVIHSVHGSSEAESKTMVAPTESAVRFSIRNALDRTDIPIEHIGVVDTHGSANPLSDLVEARSLAAELRPQAGLNPVQITAIKSHIGHIYGGSGASSLLSTIQALRTRKVPGIRNLETPRPEIEEIKDRVQPRHGTEALGPEVKAGAANSLGLGGANYFAIVTTPEKKTDKKTRKTIPTMTHVSAQHTTLDAEDRSFRFQDADSSNIFICLTERREDLGLTINRALKQTPVPQFISEGNTSSTRLAVTFENQQELRNKLASTLKMAVNGHDLSPLKSQGIFMAQAEPDAKPEKLAFCLPGQGGQYITMGRHLYDNNRHFKEILDTVHDLTFKAFDFDLLAHIYGDPNDLQLKKELGTLVGAQASVFAVELAIAQVLAGKGVKPDVILGQSFGEISALVVAGVWDIETGFEVVSERIKAAELVNRKVSAPLGMMSIICSPEQRDTMLKLAGDKLVLTNINAPNRFIFSGELDVIKHTADMAESFGANARILDIASAFHSHYMEPAREPFYKALSKLPCNPPQFPILSTVTGEYLKPENINSEFLAKHFSSQLINKVDLVRDVRRLHKDGVRHFIEIGPGWALTKMVSACLEGESFHMVPTLHPKVGDKEIFRRAQAFMMAFGHLESAAGRRKLDGLFSPDFLSYVQTFEPSVINLLYEVHRRFLGHVNGDGAVEIKVPEHAPIPIAVPGPQLRPEPVATEKSTTPPQESAPAAERVNSAGSQDVAVWVGRLKEKLVEATGYPAEMLEEHLDLEADLGVDSVQRAEIWTSFVHEFGLDPNVRPTGVRSIANLAQTLARMSGSVVSSTATAAPAPAQQPEAAPAPAQQPQAPEPAGKVTQQEQAVWIERLRDKLADTTGYPPEMLEEHLDLEADLGVDSVQRAEIWTQLVDAFSLDKDVRPKGVRTIANLALTLAQMSIDKEQGVSSSTQSSAGSTTAETEEKTEPADDRCQIFLSTATRLSDSALEPFACKNVLAIVADPEQWSDLEQKLDALGITASTISVDEFITFNETEIENHIGQCDTVMYLAHEKIRQLSAKGSSLHDALLTETSNLFAAFRAMHQGLEKHPRRIMVPVSLDGLFNGSASDNNPLSAFPAGFIRCLHYELPECRFQLIDVGLNSWEDALAQRINTVAVNLETGISPFGTITPTIARVGSPVFDQTILEKDDMVVVTGGARGIVFECVLALAEKTGCRLLLTGRTELPQGSPEWLAASPEQIEKTIRSYEINLVQKEGKKLPEAKIHGKRARCQWELVRNLERAEALGVKAEYEPCDVSDHQAFADLLKRVSQNTTIRGVVHGAGVQKSNLLQDITEEQIKLTLATKLNPMFTMLDCLLWSELRMFSAFGSITGLFGNAGQTDYSLANDLLATMVEGLSVKYPHLQAQTIDWTAWKGTGMVSDQEAKRFADSGLTLLDVQQGVSLYLAGILGSKQSRLAVFNASAPFGSVREFAKHPVAARPKSRLVLSNGRPETFVKFSLEDDVYLKQHLVELEPVVPGTFITEIFAESVVDTDLAIKEIKFRRPLLVRGDSFEVEVVKKGKRLTLLPSDRPALDAKAMANLAFATCKLGAPTVFNGENLNFDDGILQELRQIARSAKLPFYNYLDEQFSSALKTGPVFRGIRATLEQDDLFYALVELTQEARSMMAIPGEFVINPVLADMAVQVACAWGMKTHDVMAIPFEIGELHANRPTIDKDAVVVCRAHEKSADRFDLDVVVRQLDGSIVHVLEHLVLKTIAYGN